MDILAIRMYYVLLSFLMLLATWLASDALIGTGGKGQTPSLNDLFSAKEQVVAEMPATSASHYAENH